MSSKMKVKFLGTSAGWPLPRLGCDCETCQSQDPTDKRSRPSVLINNRILIDAPPDIYAELIRHDVDPTKIEYVIITHAHDDHIMGLFDLSKIYNRKDKITLITTVGILNEIRKKMKVSLHSFKKISAKPFEKIDIGNNNFLWMIPVEHTIETYGIKIKAPKPILYAPEFRRIKPSSRKHLGDLDLTVIDGSSKSKQGQAKGHQNIREGIRLAKDMRSKKVYFTNIGHDTDSHSILIDYVRSKGDNRFNIAFDGLELKI